MIFCILFNFYLNFLNAALKYYKKEEIKGEINFSGDERLVHKTQNYLLLHNQLSNYSINFIFSSLFLYLFSSSSLSSLCDSLYLRYRD